MGTRLLARRPARSAIVVLVPLLLGACAAGSASPTGSPGPSPSPTTGSGAIEHPTGATTVILRLDEGGGFVAPGFLVTEAPAFSLYGDGTAIFRDPTAQPLPPVGQVIRGVPFQALRLSEIQVQALLAFALGPGGLATALPQYQRPIADTPTTTFTIAVDGTTKRVSVNGLGIGAEAGVDPPILTALMALRARLLGFGASVSGETTWLPDRYRGILMDMTGGLDLPGTPIKWPWTAIAPADFTKASDPGLPPWPIRTLTPADVEALGVGRLEGGAQGILLDRPEGTAGSPYGFAV